MPLGEILDFVQFSLSIVIAALLIVIVSSKAFILGAK